MDQGYLAHELHNQPIVEYRHQIQQMEYIHDSQIEQNEHAIEQPREQAYVEREQACVNVPYRQPTVEYNQTEDMETALLGILEKVATEENVLSDVEFFKYMQEYEETCGESSRDSDMAVAPV